MNIRRFINKNFKQILRVIGIILFALFMIKSLNSYYEKKEQKEKREVSQKTDINNENETFSVIDYGTKNDTIKETISSFIYYCNNKDIVNAYRMLSAECKDEMFSTIEDFETDYINNMYNIKRTFEMEKWSSEGDISTYLVTLYEDILATGGNGNSKQEYFTFIKDDYGNYKLNINNYIYRKNKGVSNTANGIKVLVNQVDVYEEYEQVEITITNNTKKMICLTGNKYSNDIYIKDSNGITYSSLNSEFDNQKIVMEPNSAQVFSVNFNKIYNPNDKTRQLVLSDIILNYEEFLNSEDKPNYLKRTSIYVEY